MHFGNLNHLSIAAIAETFNEAFADYAISMHFTEEQLKEKILRDGHSLENSVGAFAGEKLVGFILQGVGVWKGKLTAYNGGTGVLPAYRGRKLTQQMYAYCLPRLKQAGAEQCLLEVIKTNQAAVKTYEAIGFKEVRNFISYKGNLNGKSILAPAPDLPIHLRQVPGLNLEQVQPFWDYQPSWQYSAAALGRISHLTNFIEITVGDVLVGYGAITKNNNRIAQFGIAPAYRRKGLGTYLFKQLTQNITGPVAVINVDAGSTETLHFMEALGLTTFISQFEMLLNLN